MSSQITFSRLKKQYETIFETDEVNHNDWEFLGRFTRDSMDTKCLCGFKIKNSNLFEHKETGLIYNFGDGCRNNFGVPAIKYFNQTQKNILKEINTLVKDAFDLCKYFQINYKLYLLIQQNKVNNFLKKVIKKFKQNKLQHNLDNNSNSEYDSNSMNIYNVIISFNPEIDENYYLYKRSDGYTMLSHSKNLSSSLTFSRYSYKFMYKVLLLDCSKFLKDIEDTSQLICLRSLSKTYYYCKLVDIHTPDSDSDSDSTF